MRKILIAVFLGIFLFPSVFAAKDEINSIPNGESYKIRIDNFLNKRSQDIKLLESMKQKLIDIQIPDNQTDTNKVYIRILIDYIIETIEGHIESDTAFQDSLNIQQEKDTVLPKEIVVQEPITSSKTLAPAFLNLENFEDNPRTILAGESAAIYEADIVSNLESIDVGEVIFTLRAVDASLAEETIKNASIYVDGILIDTNTNADIRETSSGRFNIEFLNLSDFVITEDEKELHLVIHTENIGFQRIGQTFEDFFVERLTFRDGEGQTSNQDVNPATITQAGSSYSILPGIINTTVTRDINTGLVSQFELSFDTGNNAASNNNSTPNATIDSIVFSITGSDFGINTPEFFLENTDGGNDVIQGVLSGNRIIFDVTQLSASNRIISGNTTEEYEMTIGGISANATIFLDIESDGIVYSISNVVDSNNLNIDLRRDISFGSRIFR